MIEITTGTTEEKIIRFLLKTYPVTISNIENDLNISKKIIFRVLQKLQTKNIVQLEPLSKYSDESIFRNRKKGFRIVLKILSLCVRNLRHIRKLFYITRFKAIFFKESMIIRRSVIGISNSFFKLR